MCLPVIVWWTCFVLYICMNNCCICFLVWIAPVKISCELTWSPSLNKVFELNWIELKRVTEMQSYPRYRVLVSNVHVVWWVRWYGHSFILRSVWILSCFLFLCYIDQLIEYTLLCSYCTCTYLFDTLIL